MRIILVLVMALLLVPIASASRGNISISPTPAYDQTSTISGCGYRPDAQLWLAVITYPDYNLNGTATGEDFYFLADSNGCFSMDYFFRNEGLIQIWTLQMNKTDKAWQKQDRVDVNIVEA